MKSRLLLTWFSGISILLVLWGMVFALFGLEILPVVNQGVLLSWESALYGAVLIGWGTTLLLVGRIAFHRNDKELMKILLFGLFVWLVIEGLSSLYLGVLFNAGVDLAVMLLFAVPLITRISQSAFGSTSTTSSSERTSAENGEIGSKVVANDRKEVD